MTASRPRLFTIPPDVAFLPALVRAIDRGGFPLPGSPAARAEELPHWTILVPTRRASRALAQAFVDLGAAPSRLLPRIRPIGDIDEDMIPLDSDGAMPGEHAIAPAISPLAREFLLVKLIGEWAKTHAHERLARDLSETPAQAQGLARSLAMLIDQIETEEKSAETLSALYDIDLAIHRQALIGLIDILREGLPRELSRLGLIGPAQRRSALIRWQARNWRESPPRFPVIAAGSTGSMPATAELLKTVAYLDRGAVILPGLDCEMDEASWRELGPQHAQFGLKLLLEAIGAVREEVEILPALIRSEHGQARVWLGAELMRPPGTAHRWRETVTGQRRKMAKAIHGITLIEAQSRQEEAVAIAVILRSAIEQGNRTAALVTPDRDLARRVSAELKRWNISADDSGGEPLIRTVPGRLVQLVLDCALGRFDSPSIASLLHHPMATFGRAGNVSRDARQFELAVLRNGLPRSSLGGLTGTVREARRHAHDDEHVHSASKRLLDWQWDRLDALGESVVQCLTPVSELASAIAPLPFKAQLETIIACVDLAARGERGSAIWQDQPGEALWTLFRALLDEADHHPPASFAAVAQLIGHHLRATPVRAPFAADARIAILGLLEARLIRADVTVLGGLNEGKWPARADAGPWLNRPMREALGVQAPERHIGLTAHDFAQALGGPEIYLTWSKRIGTDPVVPSRSIVTAKMLIEASGLKDVLTRGEAILAWARGLDVPARVAPVGKPKPKPPLDARPKRLSVTDIERLIRDPYAIYARKILRLEPLPALAETSSHALRGTLIHDALSRYAELVKQYATAYDALIAAGREAFGKVADQDEIMSFWWPRYERIARWFADEDAALRQTAQASFVELRGKIELPIAGENFTLAAKADRIDLLAGSGARIIDYKTGTLPSQDKVKVGFNPQLTLEAAMLDAGGFPLNQPAETRELLYIRLSGAEPAGELCPVKLDVTTVSQSHLTELQILLGQYAEPDRAYLPRLAMERERDPGEFDHLSRLDEWALSGDAR